jgi:hypothetical protein
MSAEADSIWFSRHRRRFERARSVTRQIEHARAYAVRKEEIQRNEL